MGALLSNTDLAADAVKYYLQHPDHFCEDFLGAHPTPAQRQVLQALRPGARIAIRSSHGVGKSALLAWSIIWFLALHPMANVPCTAPTFHQLKDVLWKEVRKWISASPLSGMFKVTASEVAVVGYEQAWFAAARTSTVPENLQGFHAEHLMYVIDEASGVRPEVMEVVQGALTSKDTMLIMAGNPTQLKGMFYDAFHSKRGSYTCFHFSYLDSHNQEDAQKYRNEIAQKYGEESDIFRVRVLGEFPRGEPDAFISLELAESAMMRDVNEEGPWAIGVDPARFGDDESVICYRRGRTVYPLLGYRNINGARLMEEILKVVQDVRKTGYNETIPVRVDETGVGASVVDFLLEVSDRWNLEVIPLGFGWAGDKHHADLGTMMWSEMKEALDQISLPDDEELIGQLVSRKFRIQPLDGRIKLERKEEMKRRGKGSPDRADALALCVTSVKRTSLGAASGLAIRIDELEQSGESDEIVPLLEA